jgi:hypothetical protein
MNRTSTTALALLITALAGALAAQLPDGYPEERVRYQFDKDDGVHMPDPLYLQNRVVLRSLRLETDGYGMQFSGEVVTDFEADRVPGSEELPRGQLPMVVQVELMMHDLVMRRDRNRRIVEPRPSATERGMLIEGQSATVTSSIAWGRYALAQFSLPRLDKPLPPGVYRVIARVEFAQQPESVRQALKWCSPLYGWDVEVDDLTGEVAFNPVMDRPERHDEMYREIVENHARVTNDALVYIGETFNGREVRVITPELADARNPANVVLLTHHVNTIGWIESLENGEDFVKENLERRMAQAERRADPEEKAEFIRRAHEEAEAMRRTNASGLKVYGGPNTPEELALRRSVMAALPTVYEQIMRLHDFMAERYWVLVAGVLQYNGFHTANVPGYNMYNAVQLNDNRADRDERRSKIPTGEARTRLWQEREEAWRFYPAEARRIAFDYLRTKEERDIWDSEKFTVRRDDQIELDVAKWAAFRQNFIEKFVEDTDRILRDLDTTRLYAVQLWPAARREAIEARDRVITLPFAHEYIVRVTLRDEPAENLMLEWRAEAQNYRHLGVNMDTVLARASVTPRVLQSQFDTSARLVYNLTQLEQSFIPVFRAGVKAGLAPAELPGNRPRSLPDVN